MITIIITIRIILIITNLGLAPHPDLSFWGLVTLIIIIIITTTITTIINLSDPNSYSF